MRTVAHIQTRATLIARMRKQRAEIAQYFSDVDHWNSIHPDEPIDADPDGMMQRIADGLDRALSKEPA